MKKELHIVLLNYFNYRDTNIQNDCYLKCNGVLRDKNWIRNAGYAPRGHPTSIWHHRRCSPGPGTPKAQQTASCSSTTVPPEQTKSHGAAEHPGCSRQFPRGQRDPCSGNITPTTVSSSELKPRYMSSLNTETTGKHFLTIAYCKKWLKNFCSGFPNEALVAETRSVSHRDNQVPRQECGNRVIINHLDVTLPAVALAEKPVVI